MDSVVTGGIGRGQGGRLSAGGTADGEVEVAGSAGLGAVGRRAAVSTRDAPVGAET